MGQLDPSESNNRPVKEGFLFRSVILGLSLLLSLDQGRGIIQFINSTSTYLNTDYVPVSDHMEMKKM